ncbi:MAG: DNA repair protein RecO [Chloroflexota bacterium]
MTTARTYRAEAITLKSSAFGERDRLLVLYTARNGKIHALAKGARRTTSRLAAHVDLFSHATLFLAHGRTFDLVTQGETIERFSLLRNDLGRLSLAFYAGELLDRFTEEHAPNPGLFGAVLAVMRRLADPEVDPLVALRVYELDLLALSGYRPQLHRCVGCETIIQPDLNSFSAAEGGVLCPACAERYSSAYTITLEALRLLRNLQTRPEEIIGRVRVSVQTMAEAERVLIGYIQYLLDLRLRSVGFIEVIRRLHAMPEGSAAFG